MILTRRTKNLKHLLDTIKQINDDQVRDDLVTAVKAVDLSAYNEAEKKLAGYYTL